MLLSWFHDVEVMELHIIDLVLIVLGQVSACQVPILNPHNENALFTNKSIVNIIQIMLSTT